MPSSPSQYGNAQTVGRERPGPVTLPSDEIIEAVRGARVGLLTNGTFWLEQEGDDILGMVKRACRELVVFYVEHGPLGCEDCGEPGNQTYDARLGCRVCKMWTMMGPDAEPTVDVDLLMVAMPDIGCRHYTYKSVMCSLLEQGARRRLPVIVVDYPNPVAGHKVEGNLPDPGYWIRKQSPSPWFSVPIPYRHGLTMGELALLAKDHLPSALDLHIIKLQGWHRDMYWEDTGWPYVPMDPSIYHPNTPIYFLCTGLFQGTNTSWGIGTAEPFQVIGAPWIDDDRLLHALRERQLPGVTWSRAYFLPRWEGKSNLWGFYAGALCQGVRLHVVNRDVLETARVQLTLFVEMFRLYRDKFHFVDGPALRPSTGATDNRLCDEQWTRRLAAGEGVDSILAEWKNASDSFKHTRKPYLLY